MTEPALAAALTWCVRAKDVKRALDVWSHIKRHSATGTPSVSMHARLLQLAGADDMGLGAAAVASLRRALAAEAATVAGTPEAKEVAVLRALPWPVVAALCTGLDSQSVLRLVRARASGSYTVTDDAAVPATAWLAVLRKLTGTLRVAESEAVFQFLSTEHATSAPDAVDTGALLMLRLYAQIRDFDAATNLFTRHVVGNDTAALLPREQNDGASRKPRRGRLPHYRCLLQAASDPQEATQVYLEGAADGVAWDAASYGALFRRDDTPSAVDVA